MLYLGIAIAGALGALCRWAISLFFGKTGAGFDLGTLSVNALGSFILGLSVDLYPVLSNDVIQVATIGFCGGLTTFSTFCVGVVSALEEKKISVAWKEVGLNVLASIFLVVVGSWVGAFLCK